MLIDLAIDPFDADVGAMVGLAQRAEECGASAVWVADHFSGAVIGRSWSRDPFVCLAAIASGTTTIDVGVLVANVINRHPAQLASAVNSLQSLAPGRVRLGLGSGAVPGSRFAVEHESIGWTLNSTLDRRRSLIESIEAIRAIWAGDETFGAIVDGAALPPIIVGASAWPTIEVGLGHADGVNIRRTNELGALLDRINESRPRGFEVSVLDRIESITGDEGDLVGVDRYIFGVGAPHAPACLDAIAPLLDR